MQNSLRVNAPGRILDSWVRFLGAALGGTWVFFWRFTRWLRRLPAQRSSNPSPKRAAAPLPSPSPTSLPSSHQHTHWEVGEEGHGLSTDVAVSETLASVRQRFAAAGASLFAVHERPGEKVGTLLDFIGLSVSPAQLHAKAAHAPPTAALCQAALAPGVAQPGGVGAVHLAALIGAPKAPAAAPTIQLSDVEVLPATPLLIAASVTRRQDVAGLGTALAGVQLPTPGMLTTTPLTVLLLLPPNAPTLSAAAAAMVQTVLPHGTVTTLVTAAPPSPEQPFPLLHAAVQATSSGTILLLPTLSGLTCRVALLARVAAQAGRQALLVTDGPVGVPLALAAAAVDMHAAAGAAARQAAPSTGLAGIHRLLEDAVGLATFREPLRLHQALPSPQEEAFDCDAPAVKVHVYAMPSNFTAEPLERAGDACTTSVHGAEVWAHRLLQRSAAATPNGHEADWHFVPMYGHCTTLAQREVATPAYMAAWYSRAIQWLRQAQPFFSASAGRDHVWAFSQGDGALVMGDASPAAPGVFLTHNSDVGGRGYAPGKDLPLPPYLAGKLTPVWEGLDATDTHALIHRRRSHLALFVGDARPCQGCMDPSCCRDNGLREALASLLQKDSDTAYASTLEELPPGTVQDTDFCVAPPGRHAWTPRPVAAILAGCIPVVFGSDVDLPWGDVVDWEAMVVRVSPAQVFHTANILRAIPQAERVAMRQAMAAAWHRLTWHSSQPQAGDAFCTLLQELQAKAHMRGAARSAFGHQPAG